MYSPFNEIQQQAEKLNTDVRFGAASEFRIPSITSPTNGTTSASLLDANLDDIFRRSEEIWNKKQSLRLVTGMGASLRTNKDLNQLNTSRFVSQSQQQQPQKQFELEEPVEYEGVSNVPSNEAEKYVERAFERARIAAERLFLNQPEDPKLQSAKIKLFSPKRQQPQKQQEAQQKMNRILGKGMKYLTVHLPNSPLPTHEQNLFAQKIDESLNMDCKAPIGKAIQETVKKLNTREADYIWQKVFTMFPKTSIVKIGEDVREMRSSKRWLDHIVEMGTQFLEKELEDHMESTIEANRVKARRGGIPGTHSRVEAYLNVKPPTHPIYEDGLFGAYPRWTVLFYCIRIGDPIAASKVAKELQNNAQCSTLVGILTNFSRNTSSIDEERRIKLRAEWKQNAQDCQDVHKKAVYGLFLGFDCPEENQTIEDWLWARMFTCKYAQDPNRALRQLQATICAQHGEKYFVGEGGSHLLYFAVLLLTGQLERAIHVLFKSNEHRCHSIHIALFADQLRLLLCTPKCSDEILISDVHEASICFLNFPRLMLLYVKDFELSNVNYALNYAFFLRHFELDATMAQSKVSRSVFEAFVSRMVFLSAERDAILGQLNAQGEIVPGLIDKFSSVLNASDVIGRVAFDTNVQGDSLGASHLYALANRLDDATKLICCQLSQCVSNPADPSTQKAVECARWLAARCQQQILNASDENAQFATLLYLLDLHTFFGLAAEEKHKQAVETLQKLQLIPTDPEDVQSNVTQFHSVPEEVRPLLPSICAQLMRSIVALYQDAPVGSPSTVMLKQFAKALILYTAMIPYRFPVSTNSLLLQLQSKIV